MKLLNVGCGQHYAKGWVNTDVMVNLETTPDIVVTYEEPFPDGEWDKILLSHTLEHIPWDQLDDFIDKMEKHMAPGCVVGVVGPDFQRSLDAYRHGRIGEWLMQAVSEASDPASHRTDPWPGARHWWNCSEDRVTALFTEHGFKVRHIGCEKMPRRGWPTQNESDLWQFGIEATLP